jgi:hypothetical protein
MKNSVSAAQLMVDASPRVVSVRGDWVESESVENALDPEDLLLLQSVLRDTNNTRLLDVDCVSRLREDNTTTRHLLYVLPEVIPFELRVVVQTRRVTALPLLDDLGFGGGFGLCGVMVSSVAVAAVSTAICNITPDIMIEDGNEMNSVGPVAHVPKLKRDDGESLDGKKTREPPAHGRLREVRWRWLNQVRTHRHK